LYKTMRRIVNPSSLVSLLSLVLWLATGCASRDRAPSARMSIPKIARLGGIQVGYATQEDLAKQWGEGKTIIGGHPNSGRLWRVHGTSWVLHTDGFEYSKQGLVVDALEIYESTGEMNDVPFAKLSKNGFAWLGGILPGISEDEAVQILKRETVPFTTTTNGFEITAKGFDALESSIKPLTTWTTSLGFINGRLTRLTVNASQ
jgi:hypothetical protein